jgi:GxxExxY protein
LATNTAPGLTHNATLTHRIIGLAMGVHRTLGPGLLESIYQECLCSELDRDKLAYERQKPLPVIYQGALLECGYRADIVVANEVILEIKSVDTLLPLHSAQALTYLRLSFCRVALLINFNSVILKTGIRRFVR